MEGQRHVRDLTLTGKSLFSSVLRCCVDMVSMYAWECEWVGDGLKLEVHRCKWEWE